MKTKDINDAIGINGAYLPGRFIGQDTNPRVTRAKSVKGTLRFNTLSNGWIDAPEDWELFSGSNFRIVAKQDWR